MRRRERQAWMELLEAEREAHRKERQELLNRLANPAAVQVDVPLEREPVGPPLRDTLEMAYVGGEVPDGVTVGYSIEGFVDG